MDTENIQLPDTIAGWNRKGAAKRVDRNNIFDYMNGAGELYLSYHFDHLQVLEYQGKDDNELLVEIYYMKSSNDAFGLLSTDWSGEVVALHPAGPGPDAFPTALYGKGLLRAWWGRLYIRILAFKETEGVKGTIIKLTQWITRNQASGEPPSFLSRLPRSFEINGSLWRLNRQRISYFFSHLLLNSLYYLSHDNILNLDHSCEALFAPYELITAAKPGVRSHLLLIRYANRQNALKGMERFVDSYIPEHKTERKISGANGIRGQCQVEDGWLGYRLTGRYLVVIFTHPDPTSLQAMLDQVSLKK